MNALLSVVAPVFWGLLVLSVIVFVHEGGHFLAARACGVRVLEFFLGLPCRFNLSFVSKRIGTKFGVTPLLLGGYAEISGMDPTKVECAPQVLACIHRHGVIALEDIAAELGVSEDDVKEACITLHGWGSIVAREEGEGREDGFPAALASVPRDTHGNTTLDGRAFDRAHATSEGAPWDSPMGEQAFFDQERSRTYIGVGFWKRAFMLVAGIAVNILCGFILVVGVYSIVGIETIDNVSVIGAVDEGLPAKKAGLVAGDRILMVNGAATETWEDVLHAIDAAGEGGTLTLEIWHPHNRADAHEYVPFSAYSDIDTWAAEHGAFKTVEVKPNKDGVIGINASMRTLRLNPLDSCRIAIDNIALTAQSVASLLNPQHTMEILDNSTSVVGISVMSAQAAAAGPATFLNFAALISFSLGFMNLLPIPPLDGGKLVIEAIQAITKREVPLRVQNGISIVGIVLFGALFLYMLRSDIIRFFL